MRLLLENQEAPWRVSALGGPSSVLELDYFSCPSISTHVPVAKLTLKQVDGYRELREKWGGSFRPKAFQGVGVVRSGSRLL